MTKNGSYPDTYGTPAKGAIPDIMGPLNINGEGDRLVPPNDMADVAAAYQGKGCPDPLDLIPARDGKGK